MTINSRDERYGSICGICVYSTATVKPTRGPATCAREKESRRKREIDGDRDMDICGGSREGR